jgi:DNA-directed RNA polymerase subunit M/transcription elongation factor TFIIS
MHFCKLCQNMYYIKIDDEDESKFNYYCRNCGNEEESLSSNVVVSRTEFKKEDKNYSSFVNEYTKYDPTLPRLKIVECPNTDCPGREKSERTDDENVIYIRYDDTNMKYIYLCPICDYVWKSSDKE